MNASVKVLLSAGGRLLEDESGQDLLEYALVIAFLGLAAVASLRGVGTRIVASLTYLSTTVSGSI